MFPRIIFYLNTKAEILRMADSRAEFYNAASNACVLENTP
jgi:hypothetical protein